MNEVEPRGGSVAQLEQTKLALYLSSISFLRSQRSRLQRPHWKNEREWLLRTRYVEPILRVAGQAFPQSVQGCIMIFGTSYRRFYDLNECLLTSFVQSRPSRVSGMFGSLDSVAELKNPLQQQQGYQQGYQQGQPYPQQQYPQQQYPQQPYPQQPQPQPQPQQVYVYVTTPRWYMIDQVELLIRQQPKENNHGCLMACLVGLCACCAIEGKSIFLWSVQRLTLFLTLELCSCCCNLFL